MIYIDNVHFGVDGVLPLSKVDKGVEATFDITGYDGKQEDLYVTITATLYGIPFGNEPMPIYEGGTESGENVGDEQMGADGHVAVMADTSHQATYDGEKWHVWLFPNVMEEGNHYAVVFNVLRVDSPDEDTVLEDFDLNADYFASEEFEVKDMGTEVVELKDEEDTMVYPKTHYKAVSGLEAVLEALQTGKMDVDEATELLSGKAGVDLANINTAGVARIKALGGVPVIVADIDTKIGELPSVVPFIVARRSEYVAYTYQSENYITGISMSGSLLYFHSFNRVSERDKLYQNHSVEEYNIDVLSRVIPMDDECLEEFIESNNELDVETLLMTMGDMRMMEIYGYAYNSLANLDVYNNVYEETDKGSITLDFEVDEGFELLYDDSVKLIGDMPEFEAGSRYILCIKNRYMVVNKVEG